MIVTQGLGNGALVTQGYGGYVGVVLRLALEIIQLSSYITKRLTLDSFVTKLRTMNSYVTKLLQLNSYIN